MKKIIVVLMLVLVQGAFAQSYSFKDLPSHLVSPSDAAVFMLHSKAQTTTPVILQGFSSEKKALRVFVRSSFAGIAFFSAMYTALNFVRKL